jgi:hypothetical protein
VILPLGSTAASVPLPGEPVPPGVRVFDAGGAGAPEAFDGVAWPAGSPSPLIVVERKDGKPDEDGRYRTLVGLEVPYSLNVRLAR